MKQNDKLRTVVVGSRFGQFYIEALKSLSDKFELVGLLAKGSVRSKKCADSYGIPLYTEVEQLPDQIDLACVVLRSGVMGGQGTDVSLQLLKRGIHVIQEQPVHYKDLASCFRVAQQHGVFFYTGDLYVHLPSVRRFIACTCEMLERQSARYIDISCATQVSFPLMHILFEALPTIRPWKIEHVIKDVGPLQVLTGTLGDIPVILRAHNEVDPNDPDNHLHLLHRLTIGVDGGSLSLIDIHGPVSWHPQLHVPDGYHIPSGLSIETPEYMLEHSSQTLGPNSTSSYKEILMKEWPRAIGRDLLAMREMIQGGNARTASAQRGQQELLYSRQWQELMNALGYPVLRPNRLHQPLKASVLQKAALAVDEDIEERAKQPAQNLLSEKDVFACTAFVESEITCLDAQEVKECVRRLNVAALSSMLFALQRQGTLTTSRQEYGIVDVLIGSKVARRHEHIIMRWLNILTEHGYLEQDEDRTYRLSTILMTESQVREHWDRVRAVWDGRLGSPKIIDYLMDNAEQLPLLMCDELQATWLLFPEGRMDVAHALYNETIIAKYLNESVAEGVRRIAGLKQGVLSCSNPSIPDKLTIMEIGAGTGATTAAVVRKLNHMLEKDAKLNYLFTDISPFFLNAAQKQFIECPWMQYRIMDINQDLFAQGLQPESVDAVIAAGMLNNASHTDQIIKSLMHSLAPGGWMFITEPIRESLEMLISQAFMMNRPEDERRNTNTTFMSVKQWMDVFHRAGAHQVMALPEEDHPLAPFGQKLFIVRKGF
ncbi:bifunctional Gfo/Idh/MocA family oxidoreductase/class I SAM-dependent methyltransferase [Paenibacillus sp.]|uniref:bifunctional Gfo/Idh/MocA family oxidoreductase/class I SAM-dependent methyltransferase n=1 Tax=Paenibacillus sp. TaxID=58172 RepID=UPI00281DACD3|nr:bifunctional Gfo/Idh/MocA family oxidoreductase/class I SAM-dependent methyltransferase [Paenibacillus sp.]MDR0270436.1 Gfo/Idh/MocA family oxidoreductase [Paenibacillus sp.]